MLDHAHLKNIFKGIENRVELFLVNQYKDKNMIAISRIIMEKKVGDVFQYSRIV